MAYTNAQNVSAPSTNLFSLALRPFAAIGNALIKVAEASSYAQQVNALSALSDADLEAKGTTRRAEIEYIFRAHLRL